MKRSELWLISLMVFGAGVAITPAAAEQEVIASSVPRYQVGARLPDDPMINVPAGRTIKLRDRNRRLIYSIVGPYSGSLSGWIKAIQASRARPSPPPSTSPGSGHDDRDRTRSYRPESYSGSSGSAGRAAPAPQGLDGGEQQSTGGGVAGNIERDTDRF